MKEVATAAGDSASGGSLVVYGFIFVVIGGVGVSWSVTGRPFPRRLARLGNGLAAGAIALAGVVMVVIGLIQML